MQNTSRESLELLAEAAGSRAGSRQPLPAQVTRCCLCLGPPARELHGACSASRVQLQGFGSNDHRATTTQQFAVSLPSALSLSLSLHAFFTDWGRIWSGQILEISY